MKRPNRSNSLVSNYHRLPAPSRRRASRLRRPAASSSRWPSPSSPTSIWWPPSRAESRKPSSTRSKPIGRQRPCRRFSRVAWPPAAPLSKPIRNSDSVIIRWGKRRSRIRLKWRGVRIGLSHPTRLTRITQPNRGSQFNCTTCKQTVLSYGWDVQWICSSSACAQVSSHS